MLAYRIIKLLIDSKEVLSIHEIAQKLQTDEINVLGVIEYLQDFNIVKLTIYALGLDRNSSCYYSIL